MGSVLGWTPCELGHPRQCLYRELAEGVGFEPTVRLPVRLISSQVPLTTQPPFQPRIINHLQLPASPCFFLCIPSLYPVAFEHAIRLGCPNKLPQTRGASVQRRPVALVP